MKDNFSGKNDGSKASKHKPLSKLISFITKDVNQQNESKKTVVAVRIIIISVMLYFVANLVICHAVLNVNRLTKYAFFVLLFCGIYSASYYLRSIYVFQLFSISTLIWIYFTLGQYGWNIGVQQLFLVLVFMLFFSTYRRYREKVLCTAVLCVIRILFYLKFARYEPAFSLSDSALLLMQVLNSITIFWCAGVSAYLFSRNNDEMEGKLVEYNSILQEQANTDTLTGLPNRRYAIDYIEQLIKDARTTGKGFSIAMGDIDFFKKVNDTYGHDCGDEVLRSLAMVMMQEMQQHGLAARWGGEEFLLIFRECNGDEARIKLSHISNILQNMHIHYKGIELKITMTFGLSEYDFQGDIDRTLFEADQKLYFGKERGRNRIIY